MKKYFKSVLALSFSIVLFSSCSEEETIPAPTGPSYKNLLSYEAKLLGGQTNSSLGSFYSVSQDSIYFTSKADSNQSKIDFIYYFGLGSGDSSVIASPKDIVFNNTPDQNPHPVVKNWTVKNNTTFLKLNISPTVFAALRNDSLFQADLDSNVVATKITKLKIGDVIGFKTQLGKFGAYHVRAINNATALSRSITVDVKVQE